LRAFLAQEQGGREAGFAEAYDEDFFAF